MKSPRTFKLFWWFAWEHSNVFVASSYIANPNEPVIFKNSLPDYEFMAAIKFLELLDNPLENDSVSLSIAPKKLLIFFDAFLANSIIFSRLLFFSFKDY